MQVDSYVERTSFRDRNGALRGDCKECTCSVFEKQVLPTTQKSLLGTETLIKAVTAVCSKCGHGAESHNLLPQGSPERERGYHIPGYTGHIRGSREAFAATHGEVVRQLLSVTHTPGIVPPVPVTGVFSPQKQPSRAIEKHIAGYGGFQPMCPPKKQHLLGATLPQKESRPIDTWIYNRLARIVVDETAE